MTPPASGERDLEIARGIASTLHAWVGTDQNCPHVPVCLGCRLEGEVAQALATAREEGRAEGRREQALAEWEAWATWCDIRAEEATKRAQAIWGSHERDDETAYWTQQGLRTAYLHVAATLRGPNIRAQAQGGGEG